MSMFPRNSFFNQVMPDEPVQVSLQRKTTSSPHISSALFERLSHFSYEVQDSLELLESGQPRDHEEAIGRLDNVARELREVLNSHS